MVAVLVVVGSGVDDLGFSCSFCGRGEEGGCSDAVVVVHCDGWCRCDHRIVCLVVVMAGWDLEVVAAPRVVGAS